MPVPARPSEHFLAPIPPEALQKPPGDGPARALPRIFDRPHQRVLNRAQRRVLQGKHVGQNPCFNFALTSKSLERCLGIGTRKTPVVERNAIERSPNLKHPSEVAQIHSSARIRSHFASNHQRGVGRLRAHEPLRPRPEIGLLRVAQSIGEMHNRILFCVWPDHIETDTDQGNSVFRFVRHNH